MRRRVRTSFVFISESPAQPDVPLIVEPKPEADKGNESGEQRCTTHSDSPDSHDRPISGISGVHELAVHSDVTTLEEYHSRKEENRHDREHERAGLKITLLEESEFHFSQSERYF